MKQNKSNGLDLTHFECHADFTSNQLFLGGEQDRIPDLFPICVPFNFAIESGRLACFSVSVVRADRVHFDISAVRGHEFLINEGSRLANCANRRVDTATTANLQKLNSQIQSI